jgi:hypothetical protein
LGVGVTLGYWEVQDPSLGLLLDVPLAFKKSNNLTSTKEKYIRKGETEAHGVYSRGREEFAERGKSDRGTDGVRGRLAVTNQGHSDSVVAGDRLGIESLLLQIREPASGKVWHRVVEVRVEAVENKSEEGVNGDGGVFGFEPTLELP